MEIKVSFDERETIEMTTKEIFDSLTEEHKKEIALTITEKYFDAKYEWQRDDNKEKFLNTVVSALKSQLVDELKKSEEIKNITDNAVQEVSAAFPSLIMGALINVYTANLHQQQNAIQHAMRVLPQTESLINKLRC